ncbi:MAG: hypothetical protein AAGD13_00095 [Pseudomonadota bacterium]
MAAIFLLPRERVLPLALGGLEQSSDLRVTLSETFEPQLWPIPGWRLGAIEIRRSNADADAQALLSAKDAVLTLSRRSLLRGALWVDGAEINLRMMDRGLDLPLPKGRPLISSLYARDATVRLQDAEAASVERFDLDDAALDYRGANDPFRVRVAGNWRDRRLIAAVKLTSASRIARGDWTYVDGSVSLDNETAEFQGRLLPTGLTTAPQIAGNLTAKIGNPAGLISWWRGSPADPTLINLREVELQSRIETLDDRLLARTQWSGSFHTTPVSLELTLTGGDGWRETGAGTLEGISRSGGLYSAYFDGSVVEGQGISGDMTLSVLDVQRIFDVGLLPGSYRFTTAKRGSLRGRLSASLDGFGISDAKLGLGDRVLEGDAALDLRPDRPVISLSTEVQSLPVLETIDAWGAQRSVLNRALAEIEGDLVVEVSAERSDFGAFEGGRTIATVKRSAFGSVAEINRLDLFGGTLAGEIRSSARDEMLEIDATGAEIDAERLLGHMGLTGLTGTLGGSLELTASGRVDDPEWETALGSGSMTVTQGEIALAGGAVDTTLTRSETVFFALADIDIAIADGEIVANRIDLSGPSESVVDPIEIVVRDGAVSLIQSPAFAPEPTIEGDDDTVPVDPGSATDSAANAIAVAPNESETTSERREPEPVVENEPRPVPLPAASDDTSPAVLQEVEIPNDSLGADIEEQVEAASQLASSIETVATPDAVETEEAAEDLPEAPEASPLPAIPPR